MTHYETRPSGDETSIDYQELRHEVSAIVGAQLQKYQDRGMNPHFFPNATLRWNAKRSLSGNGSAYENRGVIDVILDESAQPQSLHRHWEGKEPEQELLPATGAPDPGTTARLSNMMETLHTTIPVAEPHLIVAPFLPEQLAS